jgi:hypothetical protein
MDAVVVRLQARRERVCVGFIENGATFVQNMYMKKARCSHHVNELPDS